MPFSFKYPSVESEYNKDTNLKSDDVNCLLEWANKQSHLPKINEFQVILFLQSCYYSNETAKVALDNYFTIRTHCPDIFKCPDFNNDPLFIRCLNVGFTSVLPELTPEGYQVILIKLADCNANYYDFLYHVKYFDLIIVSLLNLNGTNNGIILLYDMKGGSLKHLARINLVVLKKYITYLQFFFLIIHDALPIRLIGIHHINVLSFIDRVISVLKPFMKKELMEIMHYHTESIDNLYKFVPKRCLPNEYGGAAGPESVLHDKTKQTLIDCEDLFREQDRLIVDESKRLGKAKNAADLFGGIDGTFKQIEID